MLQENQKKPQKTQQSDLHEIGQKKMTSGES